MSAIKAVLSTVLLCLLTSTDSTLLLKADGGSDE